MELRGGEARWVPLVCGMFGNANRSAKRITFAHGTVQNRIRSRFDPKRSDPNRFDPISKDVYLRLGLFSLRFSTAWALQVHMQVHMQSHMKVQLLFD